MTTRSAITLGCLVALGFAAVVVTRIVLVTGDEPHVIAETSAPPRILPAAGTSVNEGAHAASVATASPTATPPAPPVESPLGQAKGNIHFARKASGADGNGASINLEVRSALGVWQPGENLMRILLLEAAPTGEQVAQLVSAVQSGSLDALGPRRALIELRFVPNAQAFDRNELDSAMLIAHDGKLTSTADALAGLDWAGSLPSPQLTPPAGSEHPTIELNSGGNTETAEQSTWRQKWHLSLAVPVVTRN